MSSDFIIAVTEADFEYEVLAYSQNVPVVVDFWAEWCKPCKILTPLLETFAIDADGDFRLAKVDVDANPNLPLRFSVRSIPTVLAITQGRKVAEFSGLIPEPRIREFLSKILPPSPSSLLAQKGISLFASGNYEEAENAFHEALELDGDHPASQLGMMKICILKNLVQEAYTLYELFPPSVEYNEAERLVPLMKAMLDFKNNRLPTETDQDAAFTSSIRLISRGNLYASIDGLLDLLRLEKHFRKDRARNVLLALFDMLDPESERTRQYRSELASILFK